MSEIDPGSEFIEGRRFPFAMVGDWVLLSGISRQAMCLYAMYRMHVNQERRDGQVWPKRRDLADLMGFSSPKMIDRYNKELLALGAIEIRQRWVSPGVRGPNLVTVYLAPPPGYTGTSSLQEFYQRKRAPKPERDPGGRELEYPGGRELEYPGGRELEYPCNKTKDQPDEESTRRRGRVARPQNVDPPLSETIENKDHCLPRPHTTETTQSIEKVDGPLTRQDQTAVDLQKHTHAVATLPCAAAPPLRDGLPPNPVPPQGRP